MLQQRFQYMTYDSFREFVRMRAPRFLDDDAWVKKYWQEKWTDAKMDWRQCPDTELWMLRVNLCLF